MEVIDRKSSSANTVDLRLLTKCLFRGEHFHLTLASGALWAHWDCCCCCCWWESAHNVSGWHLCSILMRGMSSIYCPHGFTVYFWPPRYNVYFAQRCRTLHSRIAIKYRASSVQYTIYNNSWFWWLIRQIRMIVGTARLMMIVASNARNHESIACVWYTRVYCVCVLLLNVPDDLKINN